MEHNYNQGTIHINLNINLQYADDISQVSSNYVEIEALKNKLPSILNDRDLILNSTKTEEYTISSKCTEWKKCKLLGSFIDTITDIRSRKAKLMNAASQLTDIFYHKRLPYSTKIKAFNAYLSPIFLYNSELWTLTETLTKSIDSFHRRVLRTYVINSKYPKIVSNAEVYAITNQIQ